MTTHIPDSSTPEGMALYRRLLAYVRPLLGFFSLSIFGFILYALTNAWFADVLGQLVDAIEGGENITPDERLYFPVILIVIVIVRGLGGFLGAFFMEFIAHNVIHRLRCELLDRFLHLPTRYFDRHSSGHLLSTVTYNIAQVNAAVSDSLAVLIREGLTVLVLFLYLMYLNWKLTLCFVAVTPVITVVVAFASKKFRKHSKRIQASMGDVTQALSETLKGLKVVRTFGAERQVTERFTQASANNRRQSLKMASTSATAAPIIQLVVASPLSFLIWLALEPSALAEISPGKFVAFIAAASVMLKPIRQLSKTNAAIQRGLAAAQSVFELMDETPEKNSGSYRAERVKGEVVFEGVSFRYEAGQRLVLSDIHFQCPAGRSIAIVGKSGSGKSTLVNLLPRFYEPSEGRILIDGVPHSEYDLANLRSHIALVSQQVILFNGSIRDNIAYGELAGASDEQVLAALSHANAMEFIANLPEGIHTLVGDDGVLLSGGQRQRLAIARAILKDAPILILDEATSALDTESERYIQAALDHLMKGRTTFVIAHRLSTIENADHILVMRNGQIVEQGSHSALLQQGGDYARLHQVQFSEE